MMLPERFRGLMGFLKSNNYRVRVELSGSYYGGNLEIRMFKNAFRRGEYWVLSMPFGAVTLKQEGVE